MKYMFVFAHPDDESVACAGTIQRLIKNGDQVHLIVATAGDAGEVMEPAKPLLQQLGSVEKVRRSELYAVSKHLHLTSCTVLNHKDGEINNKSVWGQLRQDIISQIEEVQPDIVITFDHTGWYYHLDHVGVSIATTLAFEQSVYRPQALLFSHYQPGGMKWKYVFRPIVFTHQVEIVDLDYKQRAIEIHSSQDLTTPKDYLRSQHPPLEFFEVVLADDRGRQSLTNHPVFQAIQ